MAQSTKAAQETRKLSPAQRVDQSANQPAAKPNAQPQDVQGWLAAGDAALKDRNPYAALRAYAQVLRLSPDQPAAKAAMASVLRDLGAPFAAASYAGSQSALSPGGPAQQIGRAHV